MKISLHCMKIWLIKANLTKNGLIGVQLMICAIFFDYILHGMIFQKYDTVTYIELSLH